MIEHIPEDQLNDYADGSLPATERAAVDAHLAACGACRAEVAGHRRLLARLHALPRSIEPPPELRPAVLQSVRAQTPPPRSSVRSLWALRYPLAAAAVLLVVATAVVTRWAVRQRPPVGALAAPSMPPASAAPPAGIAPSALAPAAAPALDSPVAPARHALPVAFRRDEARFAGEIRDLQRQVAEERSRLSPGTVAILERNLRVIDRAIAESRAALARDPADSELGRLILSAYEQKVQLLRRATSFSS
jgi:anti-sigma factor RsiW